MSNKSIDLAKADALAARERLADTLGELQLRLSPANLASEAWKETRGFLDDVADDATRVAMKRPGLTVALTGIALVVIARGALWDVVKAGILKRRATSRKVVGLAELEEERTQ